MTELTLGSTYRKGYICSADEVIPKAPIFNAKYGEKHFFEERSSTMPFYQVKNAFENGIITNFDKLVLSLISLFSSAACTTKPIFEMLTLMGVSTDRTVLEKSVQRLHRYHLINFSKFRSSDGTVSNIRIITLTLTGSRLVKSLGIDHRFNPKAINHAEPYAVKSRAETAQLICNWLKNLPVERFAVRPVLVVDADAGAIVRPAASINIWGEKLYFEVPRRHEGWLEDITGKLRRYELVFGKSKFPSVVINGEDEAMNLEIHEALKQSGFEGEILYTDDLAMFGPCFRTCLYSFSPNNKKIRYTIGKEEREAV